jgi:hypothetical protein
MMKTFRVLSTLLLISALLPFLLIHTIVFSSIALSDLVRNQPEWKDHPPVPPVVDIDVSETSTKSTKRSTWIDGCLVPSIQKAKDSVPTGLVVTLVVAPTDPLDRQDTFNRMCNAIPTQLEHFLYPQGLDMLFIMQEEGLDWNLQQFIDCLDLKQGASNSSRTWENLDNTKLETMEYQYISDEKNKPVKVFLATTTLQYPRYIQNSPSILSQPITPRSCQAPRTYIQATRWYTQKMVHLDILKGYDFFLKIDTDVIFIDSIPFHLLQDMANKNAVFAHTAEYVPKGSKTCAQGIYQAVANFSTTVVATDTERGWKGSLCSIVPETQRDTDQYYTNFIIGRVDFWQSPWVLKWSNFLNEYHLGFFTYRWTDQIFWHYAMGLFLPAFKDYVVDYTDLRCMPLPNCWYSSYNFERFGSNAWHRCDNGGYFLHTKDSRITKSGVRHKPRAPVWNTSQPLFQSTYKHDCSKKKL